MALVKISAIAMIVTGIVMLYFSGITRWNDYKGR
jgi:cytochrome b subunit of formate dehydrogenase